MEIKLPGASGWVPLDFAALTTPPAPMDGVVGFACEDPPMTCVPSSGGASCCAFPVTVTCVLVLRGCHVALQRPSRKEVSESGGSPEENDATTLPVVMGVPQSSTTVISISVGHAATTAKLDPSCVNTGNNLVGVQPAACGVAVVLGSNPALDPAGITTSNTAILRTVLSSAKNKSISPRKAPTAKPVM